MRCAMAEASTTSAASSSAKDLVSLVDGGATYKQISAHLDGLSSAERLAQVLAVTGKRVAKLYEAVADAPPITVDDFFPTTTPDGKTLIFEGRNSLPMFSRFQKRFQRRNGRIVGYNHQTMSFVTGPGFFELVPGDETHPNEILFDYTRGEPPFVPDDFPAYKPNDKGLSNAVYAGMKDFCRRVARGVVVGAAFKNGKPADAWFSLTLP